MSGTEDGEGGGKTLLIVDDDPSIVAMLTTRLRSCGYQLVTATDGELAVERAREHRPDLILLDVMMPKMSGWEVAKLLRSDDELSSIKIIMLTAIGADLSELTAPLYDVDAHLDKPFDFTELEQTIERVLAG
jgi:CheY-like chemotaxis protein